MTALFTTFLRWRYSKGAVSVKGLSRAHAEKLVRWHGGEITCSRVEVQLDGTELLLPWTAPCRACPEECNTCSADPDCECYEHEAPPL